MMSLSPFEKFVNLQVIESNGQKVVVAFPAQEVTLNFGGTLHGGASMSIINMAARHALYPHITDEEKICIRTLDQSVRFTSTARGEKVLAEAELVKKGKELAFVDVDVRTEEGKLVSKGLVTLRYSRKEEARQECPAPLVQLDDYLPSEWHPGPMAQILAQRGFTANLGLKIQHVKDGKSVVRLDENSNILGHAGVIDDGAIGTLCDSAGAMATMAMREGAMVRGSTPSLHINYFSSLKNEPLIALGSGQWSYNESYMADVSVVGESSGTLYAEAQVLFRIVS